MRCCIPIDMIDDGVLPIIANNLYSLLLKVNPDLTPQHLHERLLSNIVSPPFYLMDRSTIELIVWFYRNELLTLQIKDDNEILIKLPTPNRVFFEKIISGTYENNFDDYKLLDQ